MKDLLVVKYIQNKLQQAQKDVELFSLILQELEELKKEQKELKLERNFLHVVYRGPDESA